MTVWNPASLADARLLLLVWIAVMVIGLGSGMVVLFWLKVRGGFWGSGVTPGPGYGDSLEQDEALRKKKRDLEGWR